MTCEVCKGPIEPGRERIRLPTCLACGDRLARRELAIKRSQVGPAFNKGGPQFLGGASFRQNMLDSGRKTSAELNDAVTQASPRPKFARYSVRRRIGVMWDAEDNCLALFDGDDPRSRGAVRYVVW